jgi:hypothetical protein
VIGEQMGQRPELDRRHHRVADPCLDAVAWDIGRGQGHEGQKRQQRGEVAHADRWRPKGDGILARQSVAPDHQHETGQRGGGIGTLPGRFPHPRDLRRAPGVREHARRVNAQEDREAEDQHGHPDLPAAPRRFM